MTPEEFAEVRRSLSEQLVDVLIGLFFGLGSWRGADADAFVADAVPLVAGTQQNLAALTATYLADLASESLGVPIAPPGVPDGDAVDLRRGVDAEQVYRRPFATVYNTLAKGGSLTTALERGRTRLAEIAEMDLQQTYAHAARSVLRDLPAQARAPFWHRELSGLESCALCVVASTQRYTVGDLSPIHPGCDCLVMPIYGRDPGQTIAPNLLEQVHAAVKELTGVADRGAREPDYRHLVVSMQREHGELGVLLVRPNDQFTGPDDLAA